MCLWVDVLPFSSVQLSKLVLFDFLKCIVTKVTKERELSYTNLTFSLYVKDSLALDIIIFSGNNHWTNIWYLPFSVLLYHLLINIGKNLWPRSFLWNHYGISKVFFGRPIHTPNPWRWQNRKYFKICATRCPKIAPPGSISS